MDFDPKVWLDVIQHNPILMIMILGTTVGTGITQAVKKTWLAFGNTEEINEKRYDVSCMWLAILSTAFATYVIFHSIIFVDVHGLGKIVALGTGTVAPLSYKFLKAVVLWKLPGLAASFGSNGAFAAKLP